MANATINLPIIKSGYVKRSDPNTVFHTDTSTAYSIVTNTAKAEYAKLYFQAQKMPDALLYNRVISATITMCVSSDAVSPIRMELTPTGDFDPDTLTYDNRPSDVYYAISYLPYFGDMTGITPTLQNMESRPTTANSVLSRLISGSRTFAFRDNVSPGRSKAALLNGSAAYVTITYDDATLVNGAAKMSSTEFLHDTVDNSVDQTVAWTIERSGSNVCAAESWTQLSAVFRYKEDGAENWTSINISGSQTRLVIPAYTFDAGKTYKYYVEVTDNTNFTSQTYTYTFATPASHIIPQNCPTSGYINPRVATTFEWYYTNGISTVSGQPATLHWREVGASTWNDVVAVSDSITLPANTFDIAHDYEWYLDGEDVTGYASETEVYTFTTSASAVSSTPLTPSNVIADKNSAINFKWKYTSNDNMPISRCVLQYKLTSSSTWITLLDTTDQITAYSAEAGTFDAGEIEWKVVPYNFDGFEGTAGRTSFISYGAPRPPVVYTDNVPFLTITWQSQEQKSYEIAVGDETFGPYFGTENSFTMPHYLEDGTYIVKVRSMGTYGLWSDWGETGATIANDPGGGLLLETEGGVDISLRWFADDPDSDYRVYRDNVLIRRTRDTQFVDKTVLGRHVYKVVNRLPDGNYSISNEAYGEASIDYPCIALLQAGEWIPILFTLKSANEPSYSETAGTIYNHLAGVTYPVVVLSGNEDSSVTYSAVFLYTQEEEHTKFKSLFGKPVALKLTDGNVVVGVMDNWSVEGRKQLWTGYSFTIRRIDWKEYSDDTN